MLIFFFLFFNLKLTYQTFIRLFALSSGFLNMDEESLIENKFIQACINVSKRAILYKPRIPKFRPEYEGVVSSASNIVIHLGCVCYQDLEDDSQDSHCFPFDLPSIYRLRKSSIKIKSLAIHDPLMCIISLILHACSLRIPTPDDWTCLIVVSLDKNKALQFVPIMLPHITIPTRFTPDDDTLENVQKAIKYCKRKCFTDNMLSLITSTGPNYVFMQTVLKLRKCANCSQISVRSNTFFCSTCQFASYCDEKCQLAHWKVHKAVCKKIKQMKEQLT